MLGIAAGLGAGLAGGFLSQGASFGLNAAAASTAHDRAKNMMTRGPLYKRIGLEAANINGILAAQGALGPNIPSIPMAAPAKASDMATQGLGAGSKMSLVPAQVNAANATSANQLAQAGQAKAQAEKIGVETQIEANKLPRSRQDAIFWADPKNAYLIRDIAINTSLPNSWPGLIAKLGAKFLTEDRVRTIFDALDEYMKGGHKPNGIVPPRGPKAGETFNPLNPEHFVPFMQGAK